MAVFHTMQDVVRYIKNLDPGIEKATMKSLLATSVATEGFAKQNVKRQFTGRNDRTLSGMLLNNTYATLESGDGKFPDIVSGVRTIAYGAIHEYGSGGLPGGAITPQKAKKLWIPQHAVSKKMTPKEFINAMKSNPHMYHLFPGMAAKIVGPQIRGARRSNQAWIPLFYLVDKVKIPERPYIRPALQSAMAVFPTYMTKYLMTVG